MIDRKEQEFIRARAAILIGVLMQRVQEKDVLDTNTGAVVVAQAVLMATALAEATPLGADTNTDVDADVTVVK